MFTISQVMVKEHYSMQTSADRRVAELETALAEKNAKLESYHKLEAELDDVVLQAAEGGCASSSLSNVS